MTKDNLPHDAAYKEFFSYPVTVKSLFMEFVPKAFVQDFNFDSLELCRADHITPDLHERFDDIIWRLRWKDTWCYVYIILEFQSTQDYWMALRIAVYTGLLYQGLVKSGVAKAGDKLPPVFPLVIYNGKSPWKAPLKLSDLIDVPHADLARFQLNQEYFVIDEQQLSQFQLENAKGEASYIFRLERAKDLQSVVAIFNEIKERFKDKKFDSLRKAIEKWFSRVLAEKKIIDPQQWAEIIRGKDMLAEKFDEWKEGFFEEGLATGRREGIAEGRMAGIAEGRIEGEKIGMDKIIASQKLTLLEMLARRFGEIPAGWKEKINHLTSPDIISALTISILSVNSPEEYEKLLHKQVKN